MARILMIDDDSDIVQASRIPLEAAGHEFHWAPGAERGLEMVQEVRPDLIILDVMMESYTSGFHVSLALRDPSPSSRFAAFRHVPILMLTAIHATTSLRFAPDDDYLPVDAFLEKSAGPEALLAAVGDLLSRGQPRGAGT
ncbi:MAG: response regulator transcription factor [Acidobacteria bacterium]|nr:response regulator transcription factor [Acidobacteriota bacterium]